MIIIQSPDAQGRLETPFGTIDYVINQGKRSTQDDAILIYYDANMLLCAVADGIASQMGGAKAAYKCLFDLLRVAHSTFTPKLFLQLNKTLVDDLKALNLAGGGCTLEGFKIDSKGVIGFHIGDSRTYEHHDGVLTQLQGDHKAGMYLINYMGSQDCEPVITNIEDSTKSFLLTTDGANKSLNKEGFVFEDMVKNISANHDNTSAIFLH